MQRSTKRPVFQCVKCKKVFKRSYNFNYHCSNVKCKDTYKCLQCGREYDHPSSLKEHQRLHGLPVLSCNKKKCDFTTKRIADLKRHYQLHFKNTPKEFVKEWGILRETCRNDPASTAVAIENEEDDVSSSNEISPNRRNEEVKIEEDIVDERNHTTFPLDIEMENGFESKEHKLDVPPAATVHHSKKNWAYRTGTPIPYKDDETDNITSSSDDEMDCELKLDFQPRTKFHNSKSLLMGNQAYRTGTSKSYSEETEVKKLLKDNKSKNHPSQTEGMGTGFLNNIDSKYSNKKEETTVAENGTPSEFVDLSQDDDDEIQAVYEKILEFVATIKCRAGTNTCSELSIQARDLCTFFAGQQYLNDSVVNFALQMFLECNRKHQDSRQILIVSSQIFQQLVAGQEGTQIDLHFLDNNADQFKKNVQRAKSLTKINIFAKKVLIIPNCYSGHWTLTVILNPLRAFGDPHKRPCTILFFDSLKASKTIPSDKIRHIMSEWLKMEYESSFDTSPSSFNKKSLHFYQPNNLEQQENGADCGVFVAYFANFVISASEDLLDSNERGDIGDFRFNMPRIGGQNPRSRIQLYQKIMSQSDSKCREIADSFATQEYKLIDPKPKKLSSSELHAVSNCHSTSNTSFTKLYATGASSNGACTSHIQEQNPWITSHLPLGVPEGKEDAWKMIEQIDLEHLLNVNERISNQVVFLLILLKVARHNLDATPKIGVIPIYWSQWFLSNETLLSEEEMDRVRADFFFGYNEINQFIMPILCNDHFTVVMFDRSKNTAVHVNSILQESEHTEILTKSIQLFAEVLGMRLSGVENKEFQRQNDGTSCGIFVVAACEKLCGQELSDLSSKESLIKKREELHQMLIDAIKKELIKVVGPQKVKLVRRDLHQMLKFL